MSIIKNFSFKMFGAALVLLMLWPLSHQAQNQLSVCAGDSVVLRLNGLTSGQATWEKSVDIFSWSSAPGTTLNNFLSFVAHDTSTGYYRALISNGTCDTLYSDTLMVAVGEPKAPVTQTPTSATKTSFTAHWSPSQSSGVAEYFLDVSRFPDFRSFVLDYNDKYMGSDTSFTVAGLTCGTNYYYRVRLRIENCATSANSNTMLARTDSCPVPPECTVRSTCSGDITDSRDGKTYQTVQIGTQCWMKKNLNVGQKIQGTLIQSSGTDNKNGSIEKYCYGNADSFCTKYGGLYMWDEMMAYGTSASTDPGPQGICPTGWHIPTDNEFTCLIKMLGGMTNAYVNMRDTVWWKTPGAEVTNSSGFSVLPGGMRHDMASFGYQTESAYFWTATESEQTRAWNRALHFNQPEVLRTGELKMGFGYSVRCVKDN